MCLYTVFFAIGRWEIVAGYLVMKALSIWKPKSSSVSTEGRSTAGLRIAVVLSLIFALWASNFLNIYISQHPNLHLNQYKLYNQSNYYKK